ncbi:MAG: 4'-phosphopantetheinyl transferase superfamily protein [Desulfovibrio sp.]|uniref:4'-phosphopantetheinyl transferase family protein n=1 Tax=Desulfovibrio sp. TaxID=885 RepID=UPI00135F0179|nr:4'-phosphopantetheinyl transferase superfamily protein [Desulfovibrio sp.]MTJ91655.1 4'-phosphopantetheinyl transferase superfamily protein [Desulfovibrio sp.]
MHQPITILYSPLPQGSNAYLRLWRKAFETALEPWLDARQLEHVRRFGQEVMETALSRLLSRALLITSAGLHGSSQNQIRMDNHNRPLFAGWQVAFSHSGQAAFCALAPAGQESPTLGLDAEALASPPPHASAYTEHELFASTALFRECTDREALRRWTIKEAMVKAAGLGLGMQPAQIPTGRFGQRAGLWQGPLGLLGWRTLACPGHWLCVAQAGRVPHSKIFLRRQDPHTLLARLTDLQQQS